ncbi:class I SAM-dependent methyltransferase [Aurantibacillus circumpalustris]|uniref:class I SAM-dependent methyltransferase n=1 Tax=Aurantibacillus circumpalustris TaxID=3036359 RepID=UPI00295A90B5|nr:class I SAM-dependent methyltransferase [Aurantibacillus circumpalustris]
MIADYLRLNIPLKDAEFDTIYPTEMRKMSKRHFTEIDVAIIAAQFLVTKPKQKILDIGSGLGKFCFVAGSYTDASYTGVDYRKHFVELCDELTTKHKFKNVRFIHNDVVNVDFTEFDSFYFFNSFLEHWDHGAGLDDTVILNYHNYKRYSEFLKNQFEKLPDGTRIVTYHAERDQIPDSYKLLNTYYNGLLNCWEKISNL